MRAVLHAKTCQGQGCPIRYKVIQSEPLEDQVSFGGVQFLLADVGFGQGVQRRSFSRPAHPVPDRPVVDIGGEVDLIFSEIEPGAKTGCAMTVRAGPDTSIIALLSVLLQDNIKDTCATV